VLVFADGHDQDRRNLPQCGTLRGIMVKLDGVHAADVIATFAAGSGFST
jgi:hypothetical protein